MISTRRFTERAQKGVALFEVGSNCWRVADASRFAVIVDAADYFKAIRLALLEAKTRVMLIGWDFDARIGFHSDERLEGEPDTVGEFLLWLVERTPSLEVYLLRWDTGALKTLFHASTLLTAARWAMHDRIHLKLDGHHPLGSSHHQKLVSIDDCLAVCGGIDMTGDRWDTRAHAHHDPRRVQPNGQPYKPWHDATTVMTGPAAGVIAHECRDRWERATGNRLAAVERSTDCWPTGLEPMAQNVAVAVARTHPKMDDQEPVHEIEQLFVDQITAARRHIYCESQYFASRRVAEAIAKRLDEPDGPEIVIINPEHAQGWLEPIAMDTARARLVAALKKRDGSNRLRLYHPYTSGGAPIYVHAKITIIDDQLIRIGSANLNNRSMRLDTECDVSISAGAQADDSLPAQIVAVRNGLLAEHLDVPQERVAAIIAETGSLISTIERLRRPGRSLRPYEIPDLNEVEKWLADNEVLDPEGPEEMFEPLTARGLLRKLRW